MDKKLLLENLEQLYPNDEGFNSQKEAIDWTVKVLALLKELEDKDKYEKFNEKAEFFSYSNLSSDTQITAYNEMKRQLKMAIEDLKISLK